MRSRATCLTLALFAVGACGAETTTTAAAANEFCLSLHDSGQPAACASNVTEIVAAPETTTLVLDAVNKAGPPRTGQLTVAVSAGGGLRVTPTSSAIPIPGQLTLTIAVSADADLQQRSVDIHVQQGDSAADQHLFLGVAQLVIGNSCANVAAFGPVGTLQASAGGLPTDSARWTSSDTSVLRVNPARGATTSLLASANGTAIVSAAVGDAVARTPCAVTQTPTSLTVSPMPAALGVGQQVQLVPLVTDYNHNAMNWPVTFESESPSVASVTAAGLVRALQTGQGHIQIQLVNSNINVSYFFQVQ